MQRDCRYPCLLGLISHEQRALESENIDLRGHMEKIMVIPAQSGNVDSPTARAVDVDLLTVGSIEPGIIAATEAFHR